ncbi:nucleotidyltransferase family protein [Methylosinus sp. H3A]|uniref:nucleotidyltransferase family protein n=1 Tax=Methylosinus sp. H3A TaxID=2785786 RepID=UPI0018C32893|nr:nucleotidyltransferase family protein [Methylosinus sp. H3A]MBG0808233.1 nucleotidyltransferase family protein [Methylosinus sp. H3A]
MIVAIVLAAGRGARFSDDGRNKLLEDLGGRPLLRHAVDAALGSRAGETVVVTGWDHERIAEALAGLPVTLVHNQFHTDGMASSLLAGLERAREAAGALVLLADMPNVSSAIVDRLIGAFEETQAAAVVPLRGGRRGNPVLLGRELFPRLAELSGDAGARGLLRATANVVEAPIHDDGVLADVDTPADLVSLRERAG